MDALGALLRRRAPARSEEDQIYEDIEAPKFVDFTVPDRSRPDDRSWFCARIGCDQNHEEVDPDALYKSFLLRVMAARSPNVRLQKALSRQQAPSAAVKWPRSAPAKPAKSRAAKLGILVSIAEKPRNSSKLKAHPIASLRSTPNQAKVTKKSPTAEKAMTTPKNRMRPPSEERFRSAKNTKLRASAQKKKPVMKALIFQTPTRAEKAASACRTPISEVAARLRKIKLDGSTVTAPAVSSLNAESQKVLDRVRETHMGQDAQKALDRVRETHMGQDVCGIKAGSCGKACCVQIKKMDTESGSVCAEEKECKDEVPSSSSRSPGDITGDEKGEKKTLENSSDLDENKENASATYDTNRDMNLNTIKDATYNIQNKNYDLPRKAIVGSSKTPQESLALEGKYKALKPTNPKPFRLRTDERGILREANLEKGKSQKETPVIRQREKAQGRVKLVCVKLARPEKPEAALCSQRPKPLEDCKKKVVPNLRSKMEKTAAQKLPKPPSVTASENTSTSLLGGGDQKKTQSTLRPQETCSRTEAGNSTNTTMSPHIRKTITVPREPVFHSIHVPKSCCAKRFERAN